MINSLYLDNATVYLFDLISESIYLDTPSPGKVEGPFAPAKLCKKLLYEQIKKTLVCNIAYFGYIDPPEKTTFKKPSLVRAKVS